jgi:hypothetical protein
MTYCTKKTFSSGGWCLDGTDRSILLSYLAPESEAAEAFFFFLSTYHFQLRFCPIAGSNPLHPPKRNPPRSNDLLDPNPAASLRIRAGFSLEVVVRVGARLDFDSTKVVFRGITRLGSRFSLCREGEQTSRQIYQSFVSRSELAFGIVQPVKIVQPDLYILL